MENSIKVIFAIIIVFCLISVEGCTNKSFFMDESYSFDYAYIQMPAGSVIEGEVEEWSEGEFSEVIQVKIDGKVYLTDTTRCVLVKKD